jgi:hypothetical protein
MPVSTASSCFTSTPKILLLTNAGVEGIFVVYFDAKVRTRQWLTPNRHAFEPKQSPSLARSVRTLQLKVELEFLLHPIPTTNQQLEFLLHPIPA